MWYVLIGFIIWELKIRIKQLYYDQILWSIDINKYFLLKRRMHDPVRRLKTSYMVSSSAFWERNLWLQWLARFSGTLIQNENIFFVMNFNVEFCWVLKVTRNEKTSLIARTPFKDKSFAKGNTRYRKVKIGLRVRLIELCQNVIVINHYS